MTRVTFVRDTETIGLSDRFDAIVLIILNVHLTIALRAQSDTSNFPS